MDQLHPAQRLVSPERLGAPLAPEGIHRGDDRARLGSPGGQDPQGRDSRGRYPQRLVQPQGRGQPDAQAGEAPGSLKRQDAPEVRRLRTGFGEHLGDHFQEAPRGAVYLHRALGEQVAISAQGYAHLGGAGVEG